MPNPNMPNIPGAASMTDSLEFVKNLWGSMGVPGMSTPGLAVPSLSPEDLEKKIADLKAVESWLNVNMTMLRGTIQALEVQRTTLVTLKTMSANFAQAMGQPAPGAPSAGATDPAAAMLPAATAWWNLLQDQFKQAVSSTMTPEATAGAAAPASSPAPAPEANAAEQAAKARNGKPKADKV
ncbi:MAG: hypothetical protein M3Y65_25140 [Pseudomonadota bacterium]|nr:hypothetical protein [Pseudomonadota bacterium]